MRTKVTGSILENMADDPAEVAQLRLKSKLMNAIIDHIDTEELTQGEAAEIMQVQRTRVNDVCNGRIDKMTIDALVAMAARPGFAQRATANTSDPTSSAVVVDGGVTKK